MDKTKNEKNEPVCHIFGAMSTEDITFCVNDSDLVLAADGGYVNLRKNSIKPDYVIGDFDSLFESPYGVKIIRLPKEKNDTDTLFAVKFGMEKGHKRFFIYGGIGGRLDHTIANIQTLAFIAERDGRGFLFGEGNIVTVIRNGSIEFSTQEKGVISVFCSGSKAEGVYESGLKFPLNDATLTSDMPLGVSNEFIGVPSSVSVRNGVLIIMWSS